MAALQILASSLGPSSPLCRRSVSKVRAYPSFPLVRKPSPADRSRPDKMITFSSLRRIRVAACATAKPSLSGKLTSMIKISMRAVGHECIYRVPSASRSDNLAPEVFQH